jgi:hypothetical protein
VSFGVISWIVFLLELFEFEIDDQKDGGESNNMVQLTVARNTVARRFVICLAFLIWIALAAGNSAAQTPAPSPLPTPAPLVAANDSPACAQAKANVTRLETRLRDWPALARYREENSKTAAPDKKEKRVVFLGDSITDGWHNPANGGFFPGKPYVNRGISGQTTPQMLIRFRPDVIALNPEV